MSSIVVEAPLEDAWDAVTDPDALSAWFGADVQLDPAPLGKAVFRFPDGTVRFAIVEEVDAPRRLAWRWWPAGDHTAITRVAVDLEPMEHDTLVSVVETAA
jgi:uncharacterized protein YndB with AHSA1/START domain